VLFFLDGIIKGPKRTIVTVENLSFCCYFLVSVCAAAVECTVSGRHSQGPPFPASVVIFIMLMLLHTNEVLINKKLGPAGLMKQLLAK